MLPAAPDTLGPSCIVADAFRVERRFYVVAVADRRGLAARAKEVCNRFLHFCKLATQSMGNKKSLSTSDSYLLTLADIKDDIGD